MLAFCSIAFNQLLAQYQPAQQLTLLSNWDNPNLPNNYNLVYNEVYGWHDGNGHEYAIIGSHAWTHFIDITNPANPILRDSVAGTFNQCIHRDYKTYGQYCYGVADEGASTLQIIDMSYLPDSVHVVYNSPQYFQRCHNIFIDTTSGYLYTAGANTQSNGTIILDLAANPENPPLVASINFNSYTHDLFVRNDTAYMNNGFDGMRIVDFSTPTNPQLIAQMPTYNQQGYNHSSWLTPNGDYLIMCDETRNKSTKVIDVRNLSNLQITSMFRSALLYPDTTSIPHNPLVAGNYACISHYHDGAQIWDISNPAAPVHIAGYDTYPTNTNYNDWYGSWGIYPFLPSGTLIASDIHNGLFVFRVPFPFPYPLATAVTTQPATCSYISNGTATVTPSGGTSPYTYLWNTGQTTPTITNMLPGTYTVTISDRYGYDLVQSVTISSPAPLLVTAQVGAETCPGTADGQIDITVSGGTPGYTYLWNTGDMIQDINGLTTGTYTVTITDAGGCVQVESIHVGYLMPGPTANAGHDTLVCGRFVQMNATAPSSGTGNWQWVTPGGTIANPNLPNTWITNLPPGTSQLVWTVVDGICTDIDTVAVRVSSTAYLDAGEDTLVCNSTLQLSGSSASPGTGTWTANPATVAFSNANAPQAIANGLQPGTYTLFWSITDATCQGTDSITVWVGRFPFAAFSYNLGGMTAAFTDLSQYATSWYWTFGDGGSSAQQNPTHTYTTPGVYQVCLVATDTCGSDTSCQAFQVGTVGITSGTQQGIRLWPNPSSGDVILQVTSPTIGAARFVLRDMQGRELWSQNHLLDGQMQELQLHLPTVAVGIYWLEVRTADWQSSKMVVRGN